MNALKDRLAENRNCDGCDVEIGRFTEQCLFDEKNNKIYCSTQGCAKEIRKKGNCLICQELNNPLVEDIIDVEGGSVHERCQEDGAPQTTRKREIEEATKEPEEASNEASQGDREAPVKRKPGRPRSKPAPEMNSTAKQAEYEDFTGRKILSGTVVPAPSDGLFDMTLRQLFEESDLEIVQQLYVYQIRYKSSKMFVASAQTPGSAFKRGIIHLLRDQ